MNHFYRDDVLGLLIERLPNLQRRLDIIDQFIGTFALYQRTLRLTHQQMGLQNLGLGFQIETI